MFRGLELRRRGGGGGGGVNENRGKVEVGGHAYANVILSCSSHEHLILPKNIRSERHAVLFYTTNIRSDRRAVLLFRRTSVLNVMLFYSIHEHPF